MTEISVDLVKGLFNERGIDFEDTDMEYIRGFFNTPASTMMSVTVEKVPVTTEKPKGKPKGKPKAKPESPSGLSEEETEKPAKGKGKAATKAKCQATTAKGTPCSKFACTGEPFCSVHLAAADPAKKDKKKKTSGEGESSAASKKKKAVKVVPKHTHGLTSPAPDSGCDLCETHGAPFEIPEYESDEIVEEEERADPTYVLEEEDFDEIDD